jgi:hydrogenase nickel incorporation protein HypB
VLQALIPRLPRERRVACLVGDVETELDAERLRRTGAPARQILTGGACHLDARQVHHQLSHLVAEPPEILFVENVGNLVCPSTYDLGEDFKIGLLSVTEGDDKPFKYPALFSRADVTLFTKVDLLPHVDFDLDRARDQLLRLRPDATVLRTSVRTGEGLDALRDLLEARRAAKQVPSGMAV